LTQMTQDIRARDGDPWVSASDLGEFAFCERAGVLAMEREIEDEGDEEPKARAGRFYDIPALEAEIERRQQILRNYAIAYSIIAIAVVVAFFVEPLSLFGSFILNFAGHIFLRERYPELGLWHSFERLRGARADLSHARAALANVPSFDHATPTPIDWWSLLQAGFESMRPAEILRDTEWRLCGKPWRILKYGSHRIPVFRKKITGSDPTKIHHAHIVRMAAYCRILEATEGGHSNFGIVLFGPTYDGVTVPIDRSCATRLKRTLVSYRELVKTRREPLPPNTFSKCRNCPHGKPEGYVPSPRYGQSDCGDRFGWTPPHSRLES
jgi:hypothetical protein